MTRSANAPTIRPQVMAANVAWKVTNVSSGSTTPLLKVPVRVSTVMPFRNSRSNEPMKLPPCVNASE